MKKKPICFCNIFITLCCLLVLSYYPPSSAKNDALEEDISHGLGIPIAIFQGKMLIPKSLTLTSNVIGYHEFEGWLRNEYITVRTGLLKEKYDPYQNLVWNKRSYELVQQNTTQDLKITVYRINFVSDGSIGSYKVVINDDNEFIEISGSNGKELWKSIFDSYSKKKETN